MEEAGVNTREIMELGLRSGAAAQLPATPAGCSTPLAAALVPFPALRSGLTEAMERFLPGPDNMDPVSPHWWPGENINTVRASGDREGNAFPLPVLTLGWKCI